ncbi:MAG: hypothetical protein ACP5IX_03360 [Patescibacteria group bacterium]
MSLEQTLRQIQGAKFWRDKKICSFLFFSLLIIIFNLVYIWLEMRKFGQPPNILIGVNSTGRWVKLLRLPLYGLIILAINFPFIYKNYEKRNKFLLDLLLISTIGIQIILLIAAVLIFNAY